MINTNHLTIPASYTLEEERATLEVKGEGLFNVTRIRKIKDKGGVSGIPKAQEEAIKKLVVRMVTNNGLRETEEDGIKKYVFDLNKSYEGKRGTQKDTRIDIQHDVEIAKRAEEKKEKVEETEKKRPAKARSAKAKKAERKINNKQSETAEKVSQVAGKAGARYVTIAYQKGSDVNAQVAIPKGSYFSVGQITQALLHSSEKTKIYLLQI